MLAKKTYKNRINDPSGNTKIMQFYCINSTYEPITSNNANTIHASHETRYINLLTYNWQEGICSYVGILKQFQIFYSEVHFYFHNPESPTSFVNIAYMIL